uniref:Si:dkey-17e16.9 n=1 Tax=Sander lucioperca TaxID=283035 RepID=A0A8D0AM79_SANLU
MQKVTTGDMQYAGTWDHIYVTLFGTEGQSERTELDNFGPDFTTGTVMIVKLDLGQRNGFCLCILYIYFGVEFWYFSKIVVTTPEGDAILFPCYRWISRGELVALRGGKVLFSNFLCFFRWRIMAEGLPHINHCDNASELPAEIRFSKTKTTEIDDTKRRMWLNYHDHHVVSNLFKNILDISIAILPEYVAKHWKEDDFYGSQFLNAVNPNVIKRCSELPPNFPVTEEMVKLFLEEGSSLQKEMEKGNIFLYDQKKMDGIPPRAYNGEPLTVTAGLCLFYRNPENKLMPIAIQLHQQPSEQNPIFLPSDPETDWLLAKMFIKNADSMDHQAVHHLMNTHFLAEVYTVAALRSFPVIHPLYKMLFPHFRYTLHINTVGRKSLIGPDGAFSKSSLGYDGLKELMRRALSKTTYSSLCLPENIRGRGLESIPNFYYRDDGLKLWNIVNSFVKAVVEYYYASDSEVYKDTELQEWISEIFTHGFLGNKASGFHTVEEVIKFITMVIFTVTAQHAAVNSGQFDYYSWVPNGSLLLHKSPPTTKGQSNMNTILETLPDVGETVSFVGMTRLLSETYTDVVPMGIYPEERFDEPAPKQMIKEFQAELSYLSEEITTRNSQLEVPYTYLNPAEIENSVAI